MRKASIGLFGCKKEQKHLFILKTLVQNLSYKKQPTFGHKKP